MHKLHFALLAPEGDGSPPPLDFNGNTTTVPASEMKDFGDAPFMTLGEALPSLSLPTAPQPAAPAQPQEQAPLAPGLAQPAANPAPEPAPQPSPVADPVAAMSAALRAADPSATASQIAEKVALALRPADVAPAEPVADPLKVEFDAVETKLAALRQQRDEDGTGDHDAEIRSLEDQRLTLNTRLTVQDELRRDTELTEFAAQSNQWDTRASTEFPSADQPGTPLRTLVEQKMNAALTADPEFFNRLPDAGYNLIAAAATQLGIAPVVHRPPPAPATTSTSIAAPLPLPGSVQGAHRPAPSPPVDPTMAWFARMAAAEASGQAGDVLSVAQEFGGQGPNAGLFVR